MLIVNEDTEVTNFGEHLLRRVIDEHFYDLLVRPRVLAGKHVPGIGLNQVYEQNTVPQLARHPGGHWKRWPTRSRVTEPDSIANACGRARAHGLRAAGNRRRRLRGRTGPLAGQAGRRRSSAARRLLEVMTDKATMEVPAPFAGTITSLRAEPGQRIKVGESSCSPMLPPKTGTPGGVVQQLPHAETESLLRHPTVHAPARQQRA